MPETAAGLPLARIVGTGSYVPEKILTNADLERMVDTSDEWIVSRTGIRERHVVAPGQTTSDMAYEAALRALDMAGIKGSELDLIVCGTVTPDTPFPSTACRLQHRLGAKDAAALDIGAACSGFLYGVHIFRNLILTGSVQRVLVIGVESLSKITNYTDRTTCVLFGDGAGAVVMVPERGGKHGILGTRIGSDGSATELLYQPAGGSRLPPSCETVSQNLHTIHMKGNEVFKLAVRGMEEVTRRVLEDCALSAGDLKLFIPHQANIRMISAIAERLGVPMERVYVNIERLGNTSAASVPIALDEAVRTGRIQPGDLFGMVVFGGGLTWGAAAVRW